MNENYQHAKMGAVAEMGAVAVAKMGPMTVAVAGAVAHA